MHKYDIVYLAGLLDGEGTLGTYRNGVGRRRRFVIEVKMTSKIIIDWLYCTFGGTLHYRMRENERSKDQWRWRVQGSVARALYIEVAPYLKIKRVAVFPKGVAGRPRK